MPMYQRMMFALIALMASSFLHAMPRQVILIRHAEKPESGPHLSLKGKERAAALAPYFLNTPALTRHGDPVAIFVQRSQNSHNSMRAQETMEPLAKALGMKLNKTYRRKDAAACATDILTNRKYDGKKVIACFEHSALGIIAQGLGVLHHTVWPKEVYDQVWIIDFVDDKVTMKKIAQQLMYGDSPAVDELRDNS
jgi:hypothetical protein